MALFESSNVEVTRLSQWLDWASGFDDSEFLALPMIQRGSVWKPEQIINLWDTLLRGMPVGSFMVNSVPANTRVLRIGRKDKAAEVLEKDGLALLDGQQRTLSMLIAWPAATTMDRRLWVDFADEPGQGQLLRLRVTSESHKFGYQRLSPSTKLPLDERRKALEAYEAEHGEGKSPEFSNTCPYTSGDSLPLDLQELISLWQLGRELWTREVEARLVKIEKYRSSKEDDSGTAAWKPYRVWDALDEDKKARVRHRIGLLADALERLFLLDVPIIKVADEIFNGDSNGDSLEPPLAIWFQRIGAGGTPLSNADYAYSVIKHRYPDTYELVETLHSSGNIATTLSATDLVMTALRLAVAEHSWDRGRPVSDAANPDKHQFHTILNQGGETFISTAFKPLITTGGMKEAFYELEGVLRYQVDSNQAGLPLLAFPLLGRPLLQVLLRWVRIAMQTGRGRELVRSSQMEILRFVLFWIMWVKDPNKASEVAFQELKVGSAEGFPAKAIYERLLEQGVAFELLAPAALSNVPDLVRSPENTEKPLRGWNGRFFVPGDSEEHQKKRAFYARWWNKNGGYVHPVLLWLQRTLVGSMSSDDVRAGREDETPYDYDHICPSSHWLGWTGKHADPTSLPLFCQDKDAHWRVGNSIGNLRVWDSVKNRSDGDVAPAIKLRLYEPTTQESHQPAQRELLGSSAIPERHKAAWKECSRDETSKKVWDKVRATAFQEAVELRAFYLYERYFSDLDFDHWLTALGEDSGRSDVASPEETSAATDEQYGINEVRDAIQV